MESTGEGIETILDIPKRTHGDQACVSTGRELTEALQPGAPLGEILTDERELVHDHAGGEVRALIPMGVEFLVGTVGIPLLQFGKEGVDKAKRGLRFVQKPLRDLRSHLWVDR